MSNIDLDDLQIYRQGDPENMLARVKELPVQCRQAWQAAMDFSLPSDYAGVDKGMRGLSTRFAFKILSRVFNFDQTEVAANPVHLLYVLEQQIEREQFPQDLHDRYLEHIKAPVRTYERERKDAKKDKQEKSSGNVVATFISTGPDHFAHARTYAEIALPLVAARETNQDIKSFL